VYVRDRPVIIRLVTDYKLPGRLRFPQRQEAFLKHVHTLSAAHQPSDQRRFEEISMGMKQSERETNHSSIFSSEAKNA
jgi:hypothetical protein